MTSADVAHRDVFGQPGLGRFWAAETVSGFGSHVTTLAVQVQNDLDGLV